MFPQSSQTKPSITVESHGESRETLADKVARYGGSEFTVRMTRHFHQAKRKSLAERDAAMAKDQNRSA